MGFVLLIYLAFSLSIHMEFLSDYLAFFSLSLWCYTHLLLREVSYSVDIKHNGHKILG